MGNGTEKKGSDDRASADESVCKTDIRGFKSHLHLHDYRSEQLTDFLASIEEIETLGKAAVGEMLVNASASANFKRDAANASGAIEMLAEHVRDLTSQLEAERANFSGLLNSYNRLVLGRPSDDQIADAFAALKRRNSCFELGSDRALIEATIKGVSLDGPKDFGTPEKLSLAEQIKESESFGVPIVVAESLNDACPETERGK